MSAKHTPGPWYLGEYRSAIARAKKILLAAGFPWSRTTGRYAPYGSAQITTHGLRVTRVGCSDTVALHIYDGHGTSDKSRQARRELQARALETLRAAGMPFDDRGFLDCGSKARAALEKAGVR